ncbi:MAG: hypothetical protein J6Y89_02150 [Lachnospiraceae bacterium]|nr:hypothetical protein [Lachnospiraceae bacterium]
MNRKLIFAFIIVEAALFIIFVILDFSDGYGMTVAILKYLSIILCMGMVLANAVGTVRSAHTPNIERTYYGAGVENTASNTLFAAVLAAAAMCFTAVSDWFLLFVDDIRPGVISFCVVQTIYLAVIMGGCTRKTAVVLAVRGILTAACFCALTDMFPKEKLLLAVVLFYAISFFGNILHLAVDTVRRKEQNPCLFRRRGLFLAGMILFMLCDLNVLLFSLGDYVIIDSAVFIALAAAAPYLIWIFYLPSQVMIVLSNIEFR